MSIGTHEWQPIDTAPKDGTSILGYDDHDMNIVYWSFSGWNLVCAGSYAEYTDWDPTHWMALPDPPR